MTNIYIRLALVLIIITIPAVSSFAQEQGIDGTYVLESRVLADGTVMKPPELMGLYNLEAGYINFNLVNRDSGGKVQSVSYIGKYSFNGDQYYQEILFVSVSNEIDGVPASYDFEKKSGTSEVKTEGGRIEFTFPPQNQIKAVFDSGTFKAQRVDGAYTDNWKKID